MIADNAITIHRRNILVTIAFYKRFGLTDQPQRIRDYPQFFLPVFLQLTDAGLLPMPVFPHGPWPPEGPPEPTGSLFAAMRLVEAASYVKGEARDQLLNGAEKLALAAAQILSQQVGRKK